ncbi:transposase-like zinc-binding protein [Chromatocurvus halotolerans]|uniref:Transposase-like zinc-binding protein n=2 Tax=Chromatocurvus halotolerans TaxID=1132028 RepID=A0A4R2KTY1_9GAMM|nr:transposase-like zinc-binding protein [Chromatocurvus halotolerans]
MAIQGATAMQLPGRQGFASTLYERHRPEQTLLYQLIAAHYPALVEQLAQQGKSLPAHVHREFEAYLKCGRLEHGFLRVRCDKCHFERLVAFSCKKRGFCPSCGARRMAETAALLADEVFPDVPLRQWVISFPFPLRYLFAAHPQAMGKVLGVVYRAISTHLIHKVGLPLVDGATGAVTLIQRFGSALNLNIHFHILFLDGVYVYRDNRPPRFQRVKAPDKAELEELVQLISQRVGRCLERQGLLEQDTESAWLELEPAEDTDAMPQILGSSISYRIAVGPQQGRKAFMIRTIRPLDRPDPRLERVAKANGFSLHAGVSCEGNQKDKRERLCRYISRPAVAVPRLSLSSTGKVVYTLKTPYRDGTTQVAFEPVDFIARLAALVPKPRVNLTRYHGVLAPNHRWRGLVTPARRGKGIKSTSNAEVRKPAERHTAMTWAQRLKRVFNIDIESAVFVADLSGSSLVSRTRTSLIEY